MTKRDLTTSPVTRAMELARGQFFVVEFSAKGGTRYTRIGEETVQEFEDKSLLAEYSTRKEVDHIGLAKWSRSIVNSAYNVMDRHCSQTPIGYWIAEDKSAVMLAELQEVREEASKLNGHAREVSSKHRVHIDVYSFTVGHEDNEKCAKRLAQTVRERLESLRDDLKNGDLNAYATSWKRAKNLPKLATGIQAESIVLALEAAKELRSNLYAEIKAKKEPVKAGAELDLLPIDSAIFLFTDAVNGTLAEISDPEVE